MGALVANDRGVHEIGPEGVTRLLDAPVTAMAAGGAGEPWVLTPEGSVLRHEPSGEWSDIGRLPDDLTGTVLLPRGDHALVGTHGAHLARVHPDGSELVAGFEAAPGRAAWHTPWGGPPSTRSLADTPEGSLLVNVHVGGLLRSDDEGATWKPLVDIDIDVHQVVAGPDGLVLAACGAGGLHLSDDGGQRWHVAVDGLHGTYCRAVTMTEGAVLVSASTGPFTHEAAVYRCDLSHPGRLERCDRGLPDAFAANIDTHWLAAAGPVAAVATENGEVYLSLDAGKHWDRLAADLPAPAALVLT